MPEKFDPFDEKGAGSDMEKGAEVLWLGDSVVINFVLKLVIEDMKGQMKRFVGCFENFSESDFQYVPHQPKAATVGANEVAFTFRHQRDPDSKLCVATFDKNENGGVNFESFKGVTMYPDEE